jgi:beta-lactamase regulating signal transducer with metallopeptidase domain/thiol-disulfide isomerase/thioredoxin
MSAFVARSGSVAGLAGDSIVLVLVVKWMVVLAVAWLAHGMLAGRNPRWRVALWRTTVVGIALVAFLSSAPPIVEYRFAPAKPPMIEVVRSVKVAPAGADRAAPEAVSVRKSIEAIDPGPATARVVHTGGGIQPASKSPGAESAPSASSGARWGAGAGSRIGSIWLAGVLILAIRLIVGSVCLAWLVRRSSEVPDAIARECRTIATRLGCRWPVRVRRTSEISIPCLAGVVRPVLLLPERDCNDVRSGDLRAILAHELTHARNHDVAWNLVAHVASIVLWFHPLAWRIRAAHSSACDAVCDAVAADLVGDVTSYSRTLARLAVRAAGKPPAHGLAMARTPDVRRRLEALNRIVFDTSLSWRHLMPAIFVGSVFVVFIGGLGFTRAEPVALANFSSQTQIERPEVPGSRTATSRAGDVPKPEDQAETGRITLRAVAAQTGRPIEGARAVLGPSSWDAKLPTATTDARGELVFEHCAPGSTVVTLQAEGFAPELREVRVGERLEPLAFRLQPASELRLRVVDVLGKPVAGAFVFAQTWRGYHSIDLRKETDSVGRFAWRSAPRDAVFYDIGKTGFMARRAIPLIASEREHVVTLHPKLVITGRVTDAKTGQPLPKCLIIEGVGFKGTDQNSWARNRASDVSGGEYRTSFDEPNDTMFVRVEALGYKPAVSRAFRADEGGQRFDFVLERALTLSGIVQLPDGKPAPGVDVILATEADQVLFQGGHFESRTSAPRSKTSADGRFAFTAPQGDFLVIALGDAGYVDASPADLAKSDVLVLVPWGRLEGELMAGSRPKANQEISFSPSRPRGGLPNGVFFYQYDSKTDNQGRFALDRVVPGPGVVTRVLVTNYGRFSQHWTCGGEAVDIRPGRTTKVRIGGKGRPVIGQIVLEGTPDSPIEWTRNPPAHMTRPKHEREKTTSAYVSLGSNFEKDGRFRIDDVTPGTYELSITINARPNPEVFEPGEAIGSVRMSVTVPDVPGGQSDEPLNLGAITAKLFERLKVGDLAPDFAVPRIAGKGKGDQLTLADYRGKLVLLDFWATWCGPCLSEMPALKDIQNTFVADPQFNLISLTCDKNDEVARKYIRENGLFWTHGFAGDLAMGVGLSYKVGAIPATYLIGRNGRILAKNLRGAELKEAVRKAMAKP